MFKRVPKTIVEMRYQYEGREGSSTSFPLSDGELFKYLEREYKQHGRLYIEYIRENEIHLTTSRTKDYDKTEEKLNDISDLIKDYIKEQAIEMTGYAVFAKGDLKGVFGREVNSRFKKSALIRDGFADDEIEIKEIQIGSFEDIQ